MEDSKRGHPPDGKHAKASDSDVRLGFLEPVQQELGDISEFISKLWLCPENIPVSAEFKCGCCDNTLACLLQLYAPLEDYPHAYHRYIYVFCCKNGSCHHGATVNLCTKVVRSQLPLKNPFFPETPSSASKAQPKSSERDDDSERHRATCRVCGLHATKRCSSCRRVTYCSQAHQVADWRARHSRECRTADPDAAIAASSKQPLPPFDCLFPEFLVEDDAEDYDEEDEEDEEEEDKEATEQKRLEQLPEEVKAAAKEFDPEQYTRVVDKVFHTFRKRIELNPDQVLRYYCAENAEPLWVNSEERPSAIPPCPHCQRPRHLEVQILPQILYYLKVDRPDGQSSVDWGTLLVYTCPNSCVVAGKNYVEEFIWRQSISKENEIDRTKMLEAVKTLREEKKPVEEDDNEDGGVDA